MEVQASPFGKRILSTTIKNVVNTIKIEPCEKQIDIGVIIEQSKINGH